jgi:hypothetical protein
MGYPEWTITANVLSLNDSVNQITMDVNQSVQNSHMGQRSKSTHRKTHR